MVTAIKAGRTDDVQRKLKTLQTPRSVCVLCVTKQNLNPGYPACPVQTKVGHCRPPEKKHCSRKVSPTAKQLHVPHLYAINPQSIHLGDL